MLDSKFLIVTTLCYVGIFGVIFIVCCCAWTRHLRKEGRGYSPRIRNNSTRRVHRPPEYPIAPSTPLYAQRGHGFAEVNFPDGNTYYPAPQRMQNLAQRNNLYPMVRHHPTTFGYTQAHFFPKSVTTNVDITLDVNGLNYGDTSQEGLSGEEFSDATSSRFDGVDSAVGENVETEEGDQTARTISPHPSENCSNDSKESDCEQSSSHIHQIKEVTL